MQQATSNKQQAGISLSDRNSTQIKSFNFNKRKNHKNTQKISFRGERSFGLFYAQIILPAGISAKGVFMKNKKRFKGLALLALTVMLSMVFIGCTDPNNNPIDETGGESSANNGVTATIFKTDITGDTIIGYTCKKEDLPDKLVIPEKINSVEIEYIGANAFSGCDKLKSIDLSQCSKLRVIYGGAFNNCSSLTTIVLPKNLKDIRLPAFGGCISLTKIRVTEGCKNYFSDENGVLFSHTCLMHYPAGKSDTSYIVPGFVESIYSPYAFDGCTSLKSIDLSKCTKMTRFKIFVCPNLTSIKLPESLTKYVSFAGWTTLESLDLSKCTALTGIDCYGCTGLTSIDLSNCTKLTSLGDYAFKGCTSLKSIDLPSSITSIGKKAFFGCSGLKSIDLPSSITSIGIDAFFGCTGLTSISVADGNTRYSSENGVLFNKDKTTLKCYPAGKTDTNYSIPSSVDWIDINAFADCTGLTSISVADGNTSYLSENGILFNKKKTKLIIYPKGKTDTNYSVPSSVTVIFDNAFESCNNLTSIDLSACTKLSTIRYKAFAGCSNAIVKLPNANFSIVKNAFGNYEGGYDSRVEKVLLPKNYTASYKLKEKVRESCNLNFPDERIGEYE